MSAQLELRPVDWNVLWEERRRLLRQMAERIGMKVCAIDLDVAPSHLSNALDERDRNLPAKWEDYLIVNGGEYADEYIRRMAALRGKDVVDALPPDPAEELTALKAALSELLPSEMREVISKNASRRTATTRRSKR